MAGRSSLHIHVYVGSTTQRDRWEIRKLTTKNDLYYKLVFAMRKGKSYP